MPISYSIDQLMTFLQINDHSILVIRQPKKDMISVINTLITKQGYKGQKLNITVWVLIDATVYLDKLVIKKERAAKKSVKMMIDKEFGLDFAKLFDLVFDTSQISNESLFGNRLVHANDNYMMEVFLSNLEVGFIDSSKVVQPKKELLFDFKELKCECKPNKILEKKDQDVETSSVAQTFI